MNVVGRDEVAHRTERVNSGKERLVRRDGRMAPQAAILQTDDGHARGKRRAQDAHVHPGNVAVGNPDIIGDGFQGIKRLIKRDGSGHADAPAGVAGSIARSGEAMTGRLC